MAKLTQEMKEFMAENLAYVATVDQDGNPNIGPKRTARILDDEHIIYNENTGGQTMRNLQDNGKIAIAYVNYEKLDGYRFVGHAEVYPDGPYMEQAQAWTAEHKKGTPKAAVVMKIERIFTLRIGKYAGTEITDAE
ncbi:MAG: pyridoxamine 5'-phosphate oxidase family protein [Eubacteriales bacterium]|nr:pyridoxamine 5'-phosphate oxidase family protein [Eubacteriales bacterium]